MPVKLTALSRNTGPGPVRAISAPAIAGPIARVAFIAIAFNVTAAINCCRGTRSGMSDVNAGNIIAVPAPSPNVNTISDHGVMAPVTVIAPMPAAMHVIQRIAVSI